MIQNLYLLQRQIEFYLSDYNLKRDKRLLNGVMKAAKNGYLQLSAVMKLSRVRQLCKDIETLEHALHSSDILTLVSEGINIQTKAVILVWVGRHNFGRPKEKAFPFRRTVFIFGIPLKHSNFLKTNVGFPLVLCDCVQNPDRRRPLQLLRRDRRDLIAKSGFVY